MRENPWSLFEFYDITLDFFPTKEPAFCEVLWSLTIGGATHEWKSATMALSPCGMGMNSWPAPLMTVRGTYF